MEQSTAPFENKTSYNVTYKVIRHSLKLRCLDRALRTGRVLDQQSLTAGHQTRSTLSTGCHAQPNRSVNYLHSQVCNFLFLQSQPKCLGHPFLTLHKTRPYARLSALTNEHAARSVPGCITDAML